MEQQGSGQELTQAEVAAWTAEWDAITASGCGGMSMECSARLERLATGRTGG